MHQQHLQEVTGLPQTVFYKDTLCQRARSKNHRRIYRHVHWTSTERSSPSCYTRSAKSAGLITSAMEQHPNFSKEYTGSSLMRPKGSEGNLHRDFEFCTRGIRCFQQHPEAGYPGQQSAPRRKVQGQPRRRNPSSLPSA